jgi:hypothetical protein
MAFCHSNNQKGKAVSKPPVYVKRVRNVWKQTSTIKLTPNALNAWKTRVEPFLRLVADEDDKAYVSANATVLKAIVNNTTGKLTLADRFLFLLACQFSTTHLPGYATLDLEHIRATRLVLSKITAYVQDISQKRPLVFLMTASPGAGKSHFINCIANRLRPQKVDPVVFNMAGMQSNEEILPSIDAARNVKVGDKMPLLFLDEFDCDPEKLPLLLPLLWDGELTIGPRGLRLGRAVIVVAGSVPSLPSLMKRARSMHPKLVLPRGHNPKLVDLFSRVNGGVFSIPGFTDTRTRMARRADKVCIAVELLRSRFGETLRDVPLGLLRFIAAADFRYGVRSIANLVASMAFDEPRKELQIKDLRLPFNRSSTLKDSCQAYHLSHPRLADGIISLWQEVTADKLSIEIGTGLAGRIFPVKLDKEVRSPENQYTLQKALAQMDERWSPSAS